jgi:hypothetical protein
MSSRSRSARRSGVVLLGVALAATSACTAARVAPRTSAYASLASPVARADQGDTTKQMLTLMSDDAAETVEVHDTARLTASLQRIANDRVAGVSIEQSDGRAYLRLNGAARGVRGGDQLFVVEGIPVSQGYAVKIPATKVKGLDLITDSAAVRPYGLTGKGVVLLVSLRER